MNLKAKIKLGARKFDFAAAFSLAVCVLFPADGFAASKFDDLVDKITTKTMINHVTNSKGKVCGAPDDDYAQKWRYAFRRHIMVCLLLGCFFHRGICVVFTK